MRLIDADELMELFVGAGQSSNRYKLGQIWELNFSEIRDVIKHAHTVDAVPVVRCKYCANREHDNYCRVIGRWVYDKEFFCAGGKRKRRASIPLPDPIPTDLT